MWHRSIMPSFRMSFAHAKHVLRTENTKSRRLMLGLVEEEAEALRPIFPTRGNIGYK